MNIFGLLNTGISVPQDLALLCTCQGSERKSGSTGMDEVTRSPEHQGVRKKGSNKPSILFILQRHIPCDLLPLNRPSSNWEITKSINPLMKLAPSGARQSLTVPNANVCNTWALGVTTSLSQSISIPRFFILPHNKVKREITKK